MQPRKISRRRLVGGAGALALYPLLAACGDSAATPTPIVAPTSAPTQTPNPASSTSPASAGGLKKVTFVMPTSLILSYSDSYVAKEGKFWEKEGLDVEVIPAAASTEALQKLVDKSVLAARGSAI